MNHGCEAISRAVGRDTGSNASMRPKRSLQASEGEKPWAAQQRQGEEKVKGVRGAGQGPNVGARCAWARRMT